MKISKLLADLWHIKATKGDVEAEFGSPRSHAQLTSVDWGLDEIAGAFALPRAEGYCKDSQAGYPRRLKVRARHDALPVARSR